MGAFTTTVSDDLRVAAWVEQFSCGNRACADLLGNHVRSVLRQRFLSLGLTPQDADDLVQECAVQVFRSIEQFDPSKGSVDSWLSGYARNVARSWWRNATTQRQSELQLDLQIDVPQPFSKELSATGTLEVALRDLDPIDQELLHMRFAFGYSFDEISEMANITSVNARKRVSRAVENLRNNPLLRDELGFSR